MKHYSCETLHKPTVHVPCLHCALAALFSGVVVCGGAAHTLCGGLKNGQAAYHDGLNLRLGSLLPLLLGSVVYA